MCALKDLTSKHSIRIHRIHTTRQAIEGVVLSLLNVYFSYNYIIYKDW